MRTDRSPMHCNTNTEYATQSTKYKIQSIYIKCKYNLYTYEIQTQYTYTFTTKNARVCIYNYVYTIGMARTTSTGPRPHSRDNADERVNHNNVRVQARSLWRSNGQWISHTYVQQMV